jgi:hypothetical protein
LTGSLNQKENVMGLSDKVIDAVSDAEVSFSKEEAFFAITVAIVVADGDISEEGLDDVTCVIQRMKLFQKQSSSDHDAMVEKIFKFLKKNGSLELASKGAESLPAELRKARYAGTATHWPRAGSIASRTSGCMGYVARHERK